MTKKLHIAYFLEDTSIAGGVRVVLAHADALLSLGHRATIITKGSPPDWRRSNAEWRYVESLQDTDTSEFDFVVGTFWTTLAEVHAIAGGRGIHFCQGYEGSFTAYKPQKPAIDAAYSLPLPKITVSPHLVEICRRFNPDSTYIGQIVDEEFYQPHSRPPGPKPRVLLVGPAQADFKGIDTGYEAVREARRLGGEFDLTRVSQWSPAEGEPIELASEFRVGITTSEMAGILAAVDFYLAPSREEEGFGLPAAEAMASGVPGVLTSISSFRSWDDAHDYGLFADGPTEMARCLLMLMFDPDLARNVSERGREVAEQFRATRTCQRLEQYFSTRLASRQLRRSP